MNYSPQLALAFAKARMRHQNPTDAAARIFAKSIIEVRGGYEEDFADSVLLGSAVTSFSTNEPGTIQTEKGIELKMYQVGIARWICVRSKRYPALYWTVPIGELSGNIDGLSCCIGSPIAINNLQLYGIQ